MADTYTDQPDGKPAQTKPEAPIGKDKEDILKIACERYDEAATADNDNDREALIDLQFLTGDQWEQKLKDERKDDGRPCLVINRLPQFVRQVTGDIRQNKPAIKVRPHGKGADKDIAEVYSGLIRNIEEASSAQRVYISAAESSARCGIGHFRICTEYSSDDAFEQDIRIRRIKNPFSVKWDPAAQEPDKSDARYCFVTELIPLDEFKARYPKASTTDFENRTHDSVSPISWWDGKKVRVAEYWVKKPVTKKLVLLKNGEVFEEGQTPEGMPEGAIERTRTVKTHKVCCYLINGVEILEDAMEWAGKHIPIITVAGEEVELGDRTIRSGVVRNAKDSQRMFNFMRSASAEWIGLQPKAPFVGTVKQFEKLEPIWRQAIRKNVPFLPYNPDPSAPNAKPERASPPTGSAAMITEASAAAEDMHATVGIYPASLGARSNETSGKAILARQREGDVGTYLYVDNLADAIRYCGRQLVDLIPKIYDTERVVRVLNEDETEDFVTLNKAGVSEGQQGVYTILTKQGQSIWKPPLDVGEYDVAVSTGPSYSTRRVESAESMMAFVQAVPQAGAASADLIAASMDWPNSDKIAQRLRRAAVAAGLAEPDPEDPMQAPKEPPPPPPDVVAKVEKDQATADKTRVETQGLQLDNATKELQLAQMMGGIQQVVQQAIEQTLVHLLSPQPQPMQIPPANGGMPTGGLPPG